jgi:hypothetical protein
MARWGSLFINRGTEIPTGRWLSAENHPTRGFANRPGWHCTASPNAPHLKQGGEWLLARRMMVLEEL